MSRFVVCSSVGAIGKPDGANGDPNHKRGLNSDRAPWVNAAVSDGTTPRDAGRLLRGLRFRAGAVSPYWGSGPWG